MNFEYNPGEMPENCDFKISPSGISKFFDYPSIWYRDNFLGETSFEGSTSSELGTVIHAIAESVAKGEPTDSSEIDKYIMSIENEEVEKNVVKSLYPGMASVLVNEYLLKNMPDDVEQTITAETKNGIYVGGTYDARLGNTLIDYKTAKTKPRTETIPFGYKIQLLAYAWILKQFGETIDRLRIVYIVRPTKTLPARVFVVNHMISDEDWDMINQTLNLMADTIIKQKEDPSLIPLLYKSMKLKDI